MENIARFRGGERSVESCHVSGCHVFFFSVLNIRVVKTVFWENGAFVPCRKQVVLTKMAKVIIDILPTRIRGFALQTPETEEND